MSDTWQKQAENLIGGGCLTFSKSRRYYVESQPSHVVGGRGNHLHTDDGRFLFDTVSGLGANLLECRNSYSLPTTTEVVFARELLRRIPFERVKIVKTGTEACMACARYMRAATGKTGILSVGYHGWSAEYIGAEEPGIGCIDTDVMQCGTLDRVLDVLHGTDDDIAGVYIEPVMLNPEVKDKLAELRKLCTAKGILLAYDEIITGFRWPKYTVAQTYGIMPDMMTLGKALGGGYPLGCVLGPASIMDIPGVFVSGTFAGEVSAMERAREIMDEVTESGLHQFWDNCNQFQTKFNYLCSGKLHAVGYGTRMVIKDKCDGLNVAKYMQEMCTKHGILIGPVLFPKYRWTATEYTRLLSATEDVVKTLDTVQLIGEPPRPIFKRN